MTEEELAGLKTMTAREWAAVSGIKLSRILRLTREGKGPPPLRVCTGVVVGNVVAALFGERIGVTPQTDDAKRRLIRRSDRQMRWQSPTRTVPSCDLGRQRDLGKPFGNDKKTPVLAGV